MASTSTRWPPCRSVNNIVMIMNNVMGMNTNRGDRTGTVNCIVTSLVTKHRTRPLATTKPVTSMMTIMPIVSMNNLGTLTGTHTQAIAETPCHHRINIKTDTKPSKTYTATLLAPSIVRRTPSVKPLNTKSMIKSASYMIKLRIGHLSPKLGATVCTS